MLKACKTGNIESDNLLHLSASSQSIIESRIVDKANKPVTEASVMLLTTADSSVVAYNFTNQNGEFSINTDKLKAPELLIMVYGFNIRRQIKKISNHSQKVNFVVSEEAIELKEFAVKSQKIWGSRDTINYIVDAFRDSSDIVIADVLRKKNKIQLPPCTIWIYISLKRIINKQKQPIE